MKNKIKLSIYLLTLGIIFGSQGLKGMGEPIKGTIRILDNLMVYPGLKKDSLMGTVDDIDDLKNKLGKEFKPNDPLVRVYIDLDLAGHNKINESHPKYNELEAYRIQKLNKGQRNKEMDRAYAKMTQDNEIPDYLPFSLLKLLKNNSTLQLNFNKNPIKLTVKQKTFAKELQSRRKRFLEEPNWFQDNESKLLKKGVLKITGHDEDREPIYGHGKNGFKND